MAHLHAIGLVTRVPQRIRVESRNLVQHIRYFIMQGRARGLS
jgi:hypothetical protein